MAISYRLHDSRPNPLMACCGRLVKRLRETSIHDSRPPAAKEPHRPSATSAEEPARAAPIAPSDDAEHDAWVRLQVRDGRLRLVFP